MVDVQILKTTWEAVMSSSRVTNFFKAAYFDDSLLLAAKEATFAYHMAIPLKVSIVPLS